jgi:phage shock protein C
MQTATQPSLIARDHTLLGICEGLGEDFGFNPLYLRVTFAVGLLWNPLAMIGAYAALGAVVLVSRLLAPNPRFARAMAGKPAAEVQPAVPPHADNESVADMLAVAA